MPATDRACRALRTLAEVRDRARTETAELRTDLKRALDDLAGVYEGEGYSEDCWPPIIAEFRRKHAEIGDLQVTRLDDKERGELVDLREGYRALVERIRDMCTRELTGALLQD